MKKGSTAAADRWYYVTAGKHTGYVRADLVTGITYGKADATSTDALNYRSGPATSFKKLGMIESNNAKIAKGEYQGFGLCSMMEAVIAAFAHIEPEMMWLRANEPDEDDPDADGLPDSVRHVHTSFTAVIMANPARSVIAGYYASLIAGLMKYHGPVEAYADKNDPNTALYFRGPDWNCMLMPRRVSFKGMNVSWNYYYNGRAIGDACTGRLVWGRNKEENLDMDKLRKGDEA